MKRYSDVLISLTSMSSRYDTSLISVLDTLKKQEVILCIPKQYRKWGLAQIPDKLRSYNNLEIFTPSKDFGPATKLLGAIEYIERFPNYQYIITFDDDRYHQDADDYIDYLLTWARKKPGHVITVGGIRLDHYPYRKKRGFRIGILVMSMRLQVFGVYYIQLPYSPKRRSYARE